MPLSLKNILEYLWSGRYKELREILIGKEAPLSQYYLGLLYARGWGVDRNLSRAAEYYQLAAKNGFSEGAYRLGSLYLGDEGLGKDLPTALKWFQYGADQGHRGAQYELGMMLLNGTACNVDQTGAVELFRLSAERGHPKAMYEYSKALRSGLGGTQDLKRADIWLKLAHCEGYRERADA